MIRLCNDLKSINRTLIQSSCPANLTRTTKKSFIPLCLKQRSSQRTIKIALLKILSSNPYVKPITDTQISNHSYLFINISSLKHSPIGDYLVTLINDYNTLRIIKSLPLFNITLSTNNRQAFQ